MIATGYRELLNTFPPDRKHNLATGAQGFG